MIRALSSNVWQFLLDDTTPTRTPSYLNFYINLIVERKTLISF